MSDLVNKRINIARQAVNAAASLGDAIRTLKELKDQRAALPVDLQDSDFVGTDIAHLTAGMVGTCLDFVVPAFDTTYQDTGNAGRNKQIIEQMRK